MNVAVVGSGYVGLVTGACLAHVGHQVTCLDKDRKKIAGLKKGVIPIFEPGLEEIIKKQAGRRLFYSTRLAEAVAGAQVVFVTVGTPGKDGGEVDLAAVEQATQELGACLDDGYHVIVFKSTIPIGTAEIVRRLIQESYLGRRGQAGPPALSSGGRAGDDPLSSSNYDIVSNPEFLRGGSAVNDFLFPQRIILGVASLKAEQVMRQLYEPIVEGNFPGREKAGRFPLLVTDPRTAEMIKYAANAFLATKISFINEVANICQLMRADVRSVARALGLDERIGPHFLQAGAGFGGSCLPKDLAGLIHMARARGYPAALLAATQEVNQRQRMMVVEKLQAHLGEPAGRTVAMLGLAYKPQSDDLREAVSLTVAAELMGRGARVQAYDPVVKEEVLRQLPDLILAETPYEACQGGDAVVLLTEWPEFASLDLQKLKGVMRKLVFIDGRNFMDPQAVRQAGFIYQGFGVP